MGLVEKIGRKLTARSNELPVPSKPDGSSTANGAVVRHVPPHVDQYGKCQTRHGYVHVDAVKGQPGLVQTAIAGSRNDSLPATRKTKAVEIQAQLQRRDVAQHHTSPGQPRTNNIVPPASRLMESQIDSRRVSPNNTRPPADGSPRGQAPQSVATGGSRGHPNALHKQTSIASSLHSSRSGKPAQFNGGINQPGNFGDQRSRSNTMPANSRRPVGISTRRMEDSAYHAGFRDAMTQLERERQGRGLGISH